MFSADLLLEKIYAAKISPVGEICCEYRSSEARADLLRKHSCGVRRLNERTKVSAVRPLPTPPPIVPLPLAASHQPNPAPNLPPPSSKPLSPAHDPIRCPARHSNSQRALCKAKTSSPQRKRARNPLIIEPKGRTSLQTSTLQN